MILISIHPFVFRKIFLLVAALLGLSSVACFADSLFMAKQYASSQSRSRRVVRAAVQPAGAPQSYALSPLAEHFSVNTSSRVPTARFVDTASVESGFQMDQIRDRSRLFPQIPTGVGSNGGLPLAAPVENQTEFNSF